MLNTLARADRPFSDADRGIAEMVSSYWANFIRSGNPNGPGLPHWPSLAEQPSKTMELGDRPGAIGVAGDAAKQAFFERFLSAPR